MSHIGKSPLHFREVNQKVGVLDSRGETLKWAQDKDAYRFLAKDSYFLWSGEKHHKSALIKNDFILEAFPKDAFQLCKERSYLRVVSPQLAKLKLSLKKSKDLFNRRSKANFRHNKALWGTNQRLLQEFILGKSALNGLSLSFYGLGFKASLEGKALNLKLGYSHSILLELPQGVSVNFPSQTNKLEGSQNIQVTGPNTSNVHTFCDVIRSFRPPECYKGKGVVWNTEKTLQQLRFARKVGKKKS